MIGIMSLSTTPESKDIILWPVVYNIYLTSTYPIYPTYGKDKIPTWESLFAIERATHNIKPK